MGDFGGATEKFAAPGRGCCAVAGLRSINSVHIVKHGPLGAQHVSPRTNAPANSCARRCACSCTFSATAVRLMLQSDLQWAAEAEPRVLPRDDAKPIVPRCTDLKCKFFFISSCMLSSVQS